MSDGKNKNVEAKRNCPNSKAMGGGVMFWARMVATGTGSLVFLDDITADNSIRINYVVSRSIYSAQIQPNT